MKNLLCKKCQNNTFNYKPIVFTDNTEHLERRCKKCNAQNGYEKQNKEIKAASHFSVLPFGKYKGQTIRDVAATDPDYARWAGENINNPFGKALGELSRIPL